MDFGLQMMMTNKTIIMAVAAVLTAGATQAQDTTAAKPFSRFSIGGYGEAVATRNFYSGHFNRYRFPEQHRFGAVVCRVSALVPTTVCTTAAPAPFWKPLCCTETAKATPVGLLKISAACQNPTAMRL